MITPVHCIKTVALAAGIALLPLKKTSAQVLESGTDKFIKEQTDQIVKYTYNTFATQKQNNKNISWTKQNNKIFFYKDFLKNLLKDNKTEKPKSFILKPYTGDIFTNEHYSIKDDINYNFNNCL